MLGLLGTLNLGTRSLQTQQQGVEVASHNLANVNNPAYARQRLIIQASAPLPTEVGSEGTGVEATAIVQLRDALVDQQIVSEGSVTGYLEAQQSALQYVQTDLGESLQSSASAVEGATKDSSVGSRGGLGDSLSSLFNAFQDLSTSPASLSNRQAVIAQAQQLVGQFHQVDQRLSNLNGQLNQSVQSDTQSANQLLSDIAQLNQEIANAELGGQGAANDLRDLRQQKLEDLSKLLNFQSATTPDGALNLSVDGNLLVSGAAVLDTLQAYDAGGGQLQLRTASSATPITLTGGHLQGTLEARDGALQSLRDGLNTLAGQLISSVNGAYRSGYDLNGGTGADFFTGTNAADIGLNAILADNPSNLQASGTAGAAGDNRVALAVAQLATSKQAALGNRTLSESYQDTITKLGFSLASVNTRLDQQQALQTLLQNRRSSASGVSLDEEMADLIKFQRSFQASARLVSTIDEMLNEVVNLQQ